MIRIPYNSIKRNETIISENTSVICTVSCGEKTKMGWEADIVKKRYLKTPGRDDLKLDVYQLIHEWNTKEHGIYSSLLKMGNKN